MARQRQWAAWIMMSLLWAPGAVALPPQAVPVTLAQTAPTTITGQLDENSRALGETGRFNNHVIQGNAGDTLILELTTDGFAALLVLIDIETGRYLGQVSGAIARLQVTLPRTGRYLISVMGSDTNRIDSYRLQWQSIRLTLEQREALERVRSLNQQVIELHQAGRYAEAIPLAEEALRIRQAQLGERHPDVVITLNNLAVLYGAQGNYTAALPLLQRALNIYETALGESHPNVAISLNNLAELYRIQGNYAAAIPLYQRTLNIFETVLGENHSDVAISLNNLALAYSNQGSYAAAFPFYQRALNIFETVLGENHPNVAISLNNLARLYQAQGNYAAALPLYQRALSIHENTLDENHPDIASSLSNLAGLYQDQGNYAAALPLYQRALNIREIVLGENHPNVATSLNDLALLYQSQSNYTAVLPFLQRALNIREASLGENHPDVAQSLNNLAGLYSNQGNYTAALPLYQRALNIFETSLGNRHPDVATSLNNLAGLYKNQGNYAAALPLYRRALNIFETSLGNRHPDVANSLNNIALLYQAQGLYGEAVALLRQGLDIEEWHLDLNLATLSEAQRQAYVTTILGTSQAPTSLHLQSAPTSPEAAELALTTLLRRKGRILDAGTSSLQVLRQNLTPADQATLDQLTDTQRQLANLTFNPPPNLPPDHYRARLAELEAEANQLESTLARRSATFRAESTPADIATVAANLPTNGVLVEYVRYRPFNAQDPRNPWGAAARYAAYLLFPDGRIEAVDLGDAAEIDAAVQSFVGLLQDTRADFQRRGTVAVQIAPDRVETVTGAIKALVFDPIAPHLQGREHLLISPDGQLNLLPFEALPFDSVQGAGRGGSVTYLVEQYQISYLNTGRDLVKFGIVPPSTNPAVVVANPDYDTASLTPPPSSGGGPGDLVAAVGSASRATSERTSGALGQLQFGPLEGTAVELDAIAPLLNNPTVLDQSRATENALKQVQSPRILHIATHGFFLADVERPAPDSRGLGILSTDNPLASTAPIGIAVENPLLRSGLALAGFNPRRSGDEDGVLTALEASQLNLFGTQLVVLSACDTGLGDVANGEGVYGLRRAFGIAGAETQLLSLWQVDDFGTQSLMARYYEKLMAGMGRSEALRVVQLEMINRGGEYSHPYYWAAFVLAGNWRSL
ncbi:CHAT domain-containing tetratricopeptide repeat protein [Leptolyngbya sp. PCC 6406]|uniref:CHAT domain-containing tetratricopeptide repeat protein n=1 Tax=Leptolyngbya sp. PCC 6406 TaxID=1173264 RepID=UPI0006858AE0|nr:CHAT domain-containing tetratricopeptide repeat protein [Leptolyngbya sp. PCC 6406]